MPDRRTGVAALFPVLLAACGTGGAGDPAGGGETGVAVDGRRLVAALCQAQDRADDPDAADRAFRNGAHGAIHDLARAVVEVDRGVAGRLHEAKQRAEDALAAGDPRRIGTDLASLTRVTRVSLELVGEPAPTCAVSSAPERSE